METTLRRYDGRWRVVLFAGILNDELIDKATMAIFGKFEPCLPQEVGTPAWWAKNDPPRTFNEQQIREIIYPAIIPWPDVAESYIKAFFDESRTSKQLNEMVRKINEGNSILGTSHAIHCAVLKDMSQKRRQYYEGKGFGKLQELVWKIKVNTEPDNFNLIRGVWYHSAWVSEPRYSMLTAPDIGIRLANARGLEAIYYRHIVRGLELAMSSNSKVEGQV